MLKLKALLNNFQQDIKKLDHIKKIDALKVKYLGKKGLLTNYIKTLKDLSFEQRKKQSQLVNQTKKKFFLQIQKKRYELDCIHLERRIKKEKIDISLPGRRIENGVAHPIIHTINHIKSFFFNLGFQSLNGFEIEDEYHNFEALNIPKNHPSRNNHDTFWFNDKYLLRTQTSSMQIRIMKTEKPPIRVIFPGKVYRNDYDATHTPMFHQIEGLIVDTKINFSHLKWIIYNFLYYFFGKNVKIRFRPSYFPFTVPSAEVDIQLTNNQYLEILGCGMVHPKVLGNMNINNKIYSACAFGIGVERATMLLYGINDIRLFFENNIRFLSQFKYN